MVLLTLKLKIIERKKAERIIRRCCRYDILWHMHSAEAELQSQTRKSPFFSFTDVLFPASSTLKNGRNNNNNNKTKKKNKTLSSQR